MSNVEIHSKRILNRVIRGIVASERIGQAFDIRSVQAKFSLKLSSL